jgi:hypothetical protein
LNIFVTELSRQTRCVPTLPPLDNSSIVDSDEALENVLGRKTTDVVQGNDPNHDDSIAHYTTPPPLDNQSALEVSSVGDSDEALENENVLGRKTTDVVRGNDPNHDDSIAHYTTPPPLDNQSALEVSSVGDSDEALENENVLGRKTTDVDRGNNPNHDVSNNAVTNVTLTLTHKVREVGGLKDRVEERKVIFFPIDDNDAL